VSDSTRSFVLGAGGSGGDVRTNASLSMTNAGNAINGTARAPLSVSVTNCTGGASSGSGVATITMPALSTSFYQGIASQTYSGLTLNGGTFTFPSAYAVIYVTGDLNVNAATAISGTGTFCVTGNININGSISYANGSSKAAFLTPGTITLNSSATGIVGFFYAHNDGGTSNFIINGAVTNSSGSLVSDNFTFNGGSYTVNITEDPWLNATTGASLRLSGY
jgi:hypothetical protein